MPHSQYLAKNNAVFCGRQIETKRISFWISFSGSTPAMFPTMETIARYKKDPRLWQLFQQIVKIPIRLQFVCFRGFSNAVCDCAGFGSADRIDLEPVVSDD